MKKINFTPKAKKVSVIAGAAVASVGILSMVLFQNNARAQIGTASASSTALTIASSGTVSINPINSDANAISHPEKETGTAFDPETESSRSEPLTVVSKPTSAPPKPVVEGDSKNGQQPTNSALTDKTKKPTYASKPAASKSTTSKSAAGYNDPVFGNKTSPKGHMIQDKPTDHDGDINKQVGIMD